MKTIVILYESGSKYAKEQAFSQKSACEITYEWAKAFASDDDIVKIHASSNVAQLLEEMNRISLQKKADNIIFSFDDLPFINNKLTQMLLEQHLKYHAEYSFSDGYPSGFAPEIINAGCLSIMSSLALSNFKEAGQKSVSRSAIYDFIKNDINSFEVETLIAPQDWRLLRFEFNAASKRNFLSSCALEKAVEKEGLDFSDVDKLSQLAAASVEVLKSLPAFYEIQICNAFSSSIYNPMKNGKLKTDEKMSYESFCKLVDGISAFSEDCVISLSAYAEPFYHPDLVKMAQYVLQKTEISLFLETNALNLREEDCRLLKESLENAPSSKINQYQKLMIAVKVDAFSQAGYKNIYEKACDGDYQKLLNNISLLEKYLPGCIYPQFTRMNENEAELEAFYRFWNEKTSPTGGNFIIQKYDSLAGLLPDRKPADLSPVERYSCWHIRRDMVILPDGSVPCCKACIFEKPLGNVFSEGLEAVWHKNDCFLEKISEKCGKCDEFYTFNF